MFLDLLTWVFLRGVHFEAEQLYNFWHLKFEFPPPRDTFVRTHPAQEGGWQDEFGVPGGARCPF